MKDSRIGSYGTAALFMVLAIKAASLSAMPIAQAVGGILIAQVVSRWLAISFLIDMPYVSGEGKSKPLATALSLRDWLLAGLPVLLLSGFAQASQWLLLLLILGGFRLGFGRYLSRRIQGYTGDALGAAQQLSEILIYLVILL